MSLKNISPTSGSGNHILVCNIQHAPKCWHIRDYIHNTVQDEVASQTKFSGCFVHPTQEFSLDNVANIPIDFFFNGENISHRGVVGLFNPPI